MEETITTIKKAGIKFWVLTGDRIENTMNIAYACKLLNNSLVRICINYGSEEEVIYQIHKEYKNVNK